MAWREVADIHQRDADPSWCEKMPRKLFGWTRNTSVKVSPGQTLSSIPALIYISLSPIVKWVCQDQRSSGFSGSNLGCSMFIQFWSMSSWVYRNAQSWFLSQEPNSRDFPVHPVPWSPEYRSCKPSSNPVDHSILHLAQELDTSVIVHVYRNSLLEKEKKTSVIPWTFSLAAPNPVPELRKNGRRLQRIIVPEGNCWHANRRETHLIVSQRQCVNQKRNTKKTKLKMPKRLRAEGNNILKLWE